MLQGSTFDGFDRAFTIGSKLKRQRINRFNDAKQFHKGMPLVASLSNLPCRRGIFVQQAIQIIA